MSPLTIICLGIAIFSALVFIGAHCLELDDIVAVVTAILLIVSSAIAILSANTTICKKSEIQEYPLSEYDFKFKIVEFEEQKDTILVVEKRVNL